LADAGHKIFTGSISTASDLKANLKHITPSDSTFQAGFETATVSNQKLGRYYLRSMEMAAKKEAEPWHIPNDDRNVINLEHVLPQSPGGNWPQFTDDAVKMFCKRIGNLCLMRASDNSTAKSAGFSVKKPVLAQSPYELTKQIGAMGKWTVGEIAARQKTLAKIAIKAWPI
jgi:hypothetical protein